MRKKKTEPRRLSLVAFRLASRVPAGVTPTEATVKELRPLLDRIDLKTLLPPFPTRSHLTDADWSNLVLKMHQAAIVVLDAAVCAGERGVALTKNRVFDALASRWSPTFRQANATRAWDMKPETVTAAWRDLVEHGIRFNNFWTLDHAQRPVSGRAS